MYVCAELRPLGPTELAFRRRALRDAVICIGWFKLISVILYATLLVLTYLNSEGKMSSLIQMMILIAVPLQIINGVFLFMGALEKQSYALDLALWLIIILAAYNTILGVIGGIYFIRTGHLTVHFFTAVLYGFLALSIFSVMCHDIIVIYTFKTIIEPQAQYVAPEPPSQGTDTRQDPRQEPRQDPRIP